MTRPVPRMASDLVRIWLSTGIGFAVSMVLSIGWAFLALRNDVPLGRNTAIIVSTLGLIIVLFAVHQILTWRVFAGLGRQELRDVVCRTNPRSQVQRWFNLVSGNGPKSWSLVASATALIVVVLVIVNTELRSNPVAIGASVATVALGWTMIVFANATTYLRENSERLDQLEFPDCDEDHPPAWRDYFYLSVQVSTTFSTSDVVVRTTGMRGKVTAHSIAAFVFNTVIIALVVSAIMITVS